MRMDSRFAQACRLLRHCRILGCAKHGRTAWSLLFDEWDDQEMLDCKMCMLIYHIRELGYVTSAEMEDSDFDSDCGSYPESECE